jgi:hypothetical protein
VFGGAVKQLPLLREYPAPVVGVGGRDAAVKGGSFT